MSDIQDSPSSSGRLQGGLLCCGVLLVAVVASGVALEERVAGDTAIVGFVLIGWTAASCLILSTLRAHPHPRFGLANAVTAFRAAGVLLLAALIVEPQQILGERWIAASGLGLLMLDGVDGALARRSGLASDYGARFDMEVDAALTLVLSCLAWQSGAAGAEILLMLVPYYLFSTLRPVVRWLGRPLAPSLRRKAVCVGQVAAPIVVLALPLSDASARGLVLVTLAAIVWSFLRDIRVLAAHPR